MASRNFEKRRTKERKARQRAERKEEAGTRVARAQFGQIDPLTLGFGMAAGAAALLPLLGRRTLAR